MINQRKGAMFTGTHCTDVATPMARMCFVAVQSLAVNNFLGKKGDTQIVLIRSIDLPESATLLSCKDNVIHYV